MSALSQHEVIPGSALTTVDAAVEILQGMDDETVDTALPVDGSISPCAILTHCLGMMRHWSSTVNLGRPVPRDRDAEFRAAGPIAAGLVAEAADFTVTGCRAVLLHVVEELAQHLGHLEITRDVLAAGR